MAVKRVCVRVYIIYIYIYIYICVKYAKVLFLYCLSVIFKRAKTSLDNKKHTFIEQ